MMPISMNAPVALLRRSPCALKRSRGGLASYRFASTWGFIGLGQMGYPMARNLRARLPKEDKLIIFDVNPASTKQFAEEFGVASANYESSPKGGSISIATNVREVAEKSDTIVTMLPEPQHVKAVFAEILEQDLPSTKNSLERLFIDCSTIDPATSILVGDQVKSASRAAFVDAPVSGGVVGARAGTLTFMVGAPDEAMSRVEPILANMGRRIVHCGQPGAGLAAKLSNNYLLALANIATAEAMNLGIRLGLKPEVLANVVNTSTGKCWSSEVNNPVPGVIEGAPAGRGYDGGFGISLMKKDLKLALSAAEEAGAKIVMGQRAREIYEEAEKQENCKGKDFAVIYRYLGGKE